MNVHQVEVKNEGETISLVVGCLSGLIRSSLVSYESWMRNAPSRAEVIQFHRSRYLALRVLREQFENEMARQMPQEF